MRGKALISLLVLFLLVGVVSADTLIITQTASANDGRIYRSVTSETYTTIRNSAGTHVGTGDSTAQIQIRASTTENQYNQFVRQAIIFNTSGIDDAATITSAKLSLRHSSGSTHLNELGTMAIGVTRFNIAGSISADDYDNYENERLADDKAYADVVYNAWNNWTLNALGISNISKTGNTGYFFRLATDIDNTSPTWATGDENTVNFDPADSAYDPILTIEYSLGDTTPPTNIVLTGNTTTCNSINWTWTDSESDDADVVQIWQDNTFLHNVSANQTYDLWEDLEELTEYEFASHTCDLSFNCNTTWVNLSSTTLTCATPTPTPTPTPAEESGFDGYAHFNFTAWNTTPMDDWNWSVNEAFVGNGTDTFLNTWLLWGQLHNVTLTISNATDTRTITQFYNLHNATPTATPTPWQPEIMPDTEFNVAPENVISYWWIPAILFVLWLLFRR